MEEDRGDEEMVEHTAAVVNTVQARIIDSSATRAGPPPVEPDGATNASYAFDYDGEEDLFEGSGRTYDSEANFPYRPEQAGTSVLDNLLRIVSSVASSGMAARYAPMHGELVMEGVASEDELTADQEEKWKTLEALVPGLTRGVLLLGHIERCGNGTVAQRCAPLPLVECGTFSTTVDAQGCVTSAWVDSEMPLDAPERIEVQVLGGAGSEAGSSASARLVFSRDKGAQQLAKELHRAADEEAAAIHDGLGKREDSELWLAPGKPWNVRKHSHISSSFIFEPGLPLGSIVTKIKHGEVVVLGEFYSWELLEMLVRFTAMFLVYAFCVFFFLGLVFDQDTAPTSIIFLLLATRSQDNLVFYTAFLLQIVFLYITIAILPKARRIVRASSLDEMLPVKGFLVCVGYHRGDGSMFGKSLAAALSQAGISAWCEDTSTQNACLLRPQIMRAAQESCYQVVIVTAGMLCSPSSCLHMLEALRRPASRSVFYINSAPELWKVDGFGRPLRADHATQLVDALAALGMRVLTCPKKLVLHVDSLMLNPMAGSAEERILSEWWAHAAPANGQISRNFESKVRVTLSRPGRMWRLPFGRRMHANILNRRGRLFLPQDAITSGFTYVTTEQSGGSSVHVPFANIAGGDDVTDDAEGQEMRGQAADRENFKLKWGPVWNVPIFGLLMLGLVVGLGLFILFGPYGKTDHDIAAFLSGAQASCKSTGHNKAYSEAGTAAADQSTDGSGVESISAARALKITTMSVPQAWCIAPFDGCCVRCSEHNADVSSATQCLAFSLVPKNDQDQECRLVLQSKKLSGDDIVKAGGWEWETIQGASSGKAFDARDFSGASWPFFSMLQIMAVFIVTNAPVALWRFFDCRLTHSPEILPLLVAAQELRRRKASLLVFPGSARDDAGGWRALTGLCDFLADCHLPVTTMGFLDECGPPTASDTHHKSFYVLCIDSPTTARAYFQGWRGVHADQVLLVIDPSVYRAVPELRIIDAVHLRARSMFVKELLQVMGLKLGRFCHHGIDLRELASTNPPQAQTNDFNLDGIQ